MAKVEIYIWTTCPFCIKAKKLLDRKNIQYTEYDITGNNDKRAQMMIRSNGAKSVPQIFINDKHIGGCDALHALESSHKLDGLLRDE